MNEDVQIKYENLLSFCKRENIQLEAMFGDDNEAAIDLNILSDDGFVVSTYDTIGKYVN